MGQCVVSLGDLHELVRTDPDTAWPMVLAYIRNHPASAAAIDLIEDLVYEHNDRFISRIEAAALTQEAVRFVVEQAYVGGITTEGADKFGALQERLRGTATS